MVCVWRIIPVWSCLSDLWTRGCFVCLPYVPLLVCGMPYVSSAHVSLYIRFSVGVCAMDSVLLSMSAL